MTVLKEQVNNHKERYTAMLNAKELEMQLLQHTLEEAQAEHAAEVEQVRWWRRVLFGLVG